MDFVNYRNVYDLPTYVPGEYYLNVIERQLPYKIHFSDENDRIDLRDIDKLTTDIWTAMSVSSHDNVGGANYWFANEQDAFLVKIIFCGNK